MRNFAMAALAVCLSFMALASTALAEQPVWTIGGETVKENIAVNSKYESFKIEDMKTPTGAVQVECKANDEGTVGVEGKDEVTKVTVEGCKPVTGGCTEGTIVVKPVHLPWKTQLQEPAEGSNRDKVSSSGAGTPGWKVECTIIGVKVTDECTGEVTHDVLAVSGGVDMLFETEAESESLNCSLGGAHEGLVSAVDLDENVSGKALSIKVGCLAAQPCFEMKNPGGAFTAVGQKRTIEVMDTVAAGKPSALAVVATRVGFFTINETQVATCRTMNYALNQVCTFEVTYSKERKANEAIVALNMLVVPGIEPKDRLRLLV